MKKEYIVRYGTGAYNAAPYWTEDHSTSLYGDNDQDIINRIKQFVLENSLDDDFDNTDYIQVKKIYEKTGEDEYRDIIFHPQFLKEVNEYILEQRDKYENMDAQIFQKRQMQKEHQIRLDFLYEYMDLAESVEGQKVSSILSKKINKLQDDMDDIKNQQKKLNALIQTTKKLSGAIYDATRTERPET